MFLKLIYLKNSTFPSVKITVDTLIYVKNETSKHHFLKSDKIDPSATITQKYTLWRLPFVL